MNLFDLSEYFRRLKGDIEQESNRYTQKYLSELLLELVDKTPVDTSEALSNWQVSIGAPAGARIEPYFPGKKGSTEAQSARAAYEAGVPIIKSRRYGDTVYISNLAEHIVYLEAGTSAQAPSGIVDLALMIAEERMRNVKIRLE